MSYYQKKAVIEMKKEQTSNEEHSKLPATEVAGVSVDV